MSKSEAIETICNFHGRKLHIFDGEKWRYVSVKRIIPMRMWNSEQSKWDDVEDVEILTNKEKNHYFSISCFLSGKSWIKKFNIDEIDLKARAGKVIAHTKDFTDEHWIQTARFINKLKINSTSSTPNKDKK